LTALQGISPAATGYGSTPTARPAVQTTQKPPGSTIATTPSCAAWSLSTCSSSTLCPASPRRR